jgi:hypothetical protein
VKTKQCNSCRHYHISWDKLAPHGCRAYQFKSRQLPSVVVLATSGIECQLFIEKKTIGSLSNGTTDLDKDASGTDF